MPPRSWGNRIPQKRDEIAARKRRGSLGGRPPGLDVETYKGRNVVERHFALTKQWRGLATRYDKLAITYRAATVLSACITWSRLLGGACARNGGSGPTRRARVRWDGHCE
ncbi:transposase [Pseudonocardia sp. HH130630-07]|uniref:transposase n=1 Tax=Pseudonocardia sp. HH130630-07 TaxID=1690815 RepID=UPI0009F3A2F6